MLLIPHNHRKQYVLARRRYNPVLVVEKITNLSPRSSDRVRRHHFYKERLLEMIHVYNNRMMTRFMVFFVSSRDSVELLQHGVETTMLGLPRGWQIGV